MKTGFRIWILLLGFLALFLVLNSIDPILLWDENAYLGNARSHLGTSYYQEDFKFPLIEYIIAGAWFLTEESIFIARLIAIIFALASIYLFYLISQEYFKGKSFIFTVLFSLCPLVLLWGFKAYPDILGLFLIMLAFYCIIKEKQFGKKMIFFSGIACSLAFLARFPLALFPLSVLIYFLIKREYKNTIIFLLGLVPFTLWWAIYNQMVYSDMLWDLSTYSATVKAYTTPEPISKQLMNLAYAMGMLIIFLPHGIYAMFKKKEQYSLLIITYLIISLGYYLFFVNIKFSRYYLSNIFLLYIVALFGFIYLSRERKIGFYKRFLFLTLLISIIIAGSTIAGIAWGGRCSKEGAIVQAVNHLEQNTKPGDYILSNSWVWFGYYNNLKVSSIWSNEISMLIGAYRPKYVIYTEKDGVEYDKAILDKSPELTLEKSFTGRCNDNAFIYNVIEQ